MNTKTPNPTLRTYQIFFVVLGVVCVAAIAINLVVRRVPVHDATIESDFSSISGAIDSYASSQSELPGHLSDLSGLPSAMQKRLSGYEYAPSLGLSYQLCATFLGVGTNTNTKIAKPYPAAGASPDTSRHGKGRECFSYTAQNYDTMPGRPVPQAQ